MKLYYSPGSPYARIAQILLRESGLLDETLEILAANRSPDNPVLTHSAVGRVPTLVDGDFAVTEVRYVFDYLASKSRQNLVRRPERLTWREVCQEGQILGFLEGIAGWVRENRRETHTRSDFLLEVETERSRRCLAYLEGEAQEELLPDFPTFRSVALAAAIGLMEFRKLCPSWRAAYPALAEWYSHLEDRPSMKETMPI